MPPTLSELGLDRLSPQDRMAVAEAIWESVASEADDAPLTAEQRDELNYRLADAAATGDAGEPWAVVRDRAVERKSG